VQSFVALKRPTLSKRASITASTYEHLDIEHVRQELGITTAHLLGTFQHEPNVDRLVREIKQLSTEERRELFGRLIINQLD
jgi:hypothetical protein